MAETQTLQRYTQEHAQNERATLAAQIRQERREGQQQRDNHTERVNNFIQERDNLHGQISSTQAAIDALEFRINNIKDSTVKRILNIFHLSRLETELATHHINLKEQQSRFEELNSEITQINELIASQRSAEGVRQKITDFYRGHMSQFKEHEQIQLALLEQERADSQVEKIAIEQSTVFIHSIQPNLVPGKNSLLKENVDWATKLKILLAFNPTLSTSSLQPGDGLSNMWASSGIIVGRGTVLDATPRDAQTVAKGFGERATRFGADKRPLQEKVDSALRERSPNFYNEFVIARPEIAGIYIAVESNNQTRPDCVDPQEALQLSNELGIPVYIIKNGEIFEAAIDPDGNKIQPGKKVTLDQVYGTSAYRPSEEQRQRVVQEILDNCPFKVETAERGYVDSMGTGKISYIELKGVTSKFEQATSAEISVAELEKLNTGSLYDQERGKLPIDAVKVIAEIITPETKIQYIQRSAGDKTDIMKRTVFKRGKKEPITRSLDAQSVVNKGFVDLGWTTQGLPQGAGNPQLYLHNLEAIILDLTKNQAEKSDEKKLLSLGFHVYGFAEQAEKAQDIFIRDQAFKLAELIRPRSFYEEVISRRVSQQGNFIITEEDLPHTKTPLTGN